MSYHGDIRLGDTIDVKFTTRRFSTGAPFTLAGTPVISAYVGNGTTEITAGITLTVDFDARTGLNNVRVVASSGNGFATATNVQLVITAGTVDSVSVVGEVVGEFSIESRSALMPTIAARTLDVSAGGEAGIDWANVGSPTTTLGLTNTTVGVVTLTNTLTTYTGNTVQTGDSFARIGATGSGLTTLATQASVNTVDDFLDTEIAAIITTLGTPAGVSVSADIAAVKTQTAAIEVDTAEIGAAGAGLTNINLPNQTMDIVGNITGNLSGSTGSVVGLTASDVGAIKTKTDSLTFTVANVLNANVKRVNDVTIVGNGSGTPFNV